MADGLFLCRAGSGTAQNAGCAIKPVVLKFQARHGPRVRVVPARPKIFRIVPCFGSCQTVVSRPAQKQHDPSPSSSYASYQTSCREDYLYSEKRIMSPPTSRSNGARLTSSVAVLAIGSGGQQLSQRTTIMENKELYFPLREKYDP